MHGHPLQNYHQPPTIPPSHPSSYPPSSRPLLLAWRPPGAVSRHKWRKHAKSSMLYFHGYRLAASLMAGLVRRDAPFDRWARPSQVSEQGGGREGGHVGCSARMGGVGRERGREEGAFRGGDCISLQYPLFHILLTPEEMSTFLSEE